MRYAIRHELTYTYDSPVRQSTQYLRLSPRDTARQRVVGWKIETPRPALRTDDGYGNILHVLTVDKPVSEIAILAAGIVETSVEADGPSDFTGVPLSPLLFLRMTPLTRPEAKLAALAERFRSRASTHAGVRDLAAAVHDGAPEGPSEGLSHAFIACSRLLGVPARYVSGYLYTPHGAGEPMALHAWAEAYCEERWRGFDVASRAPVGERHIKIAVGADYLDACPIRGVRTGGGAETLRAQAEVVASQ
jgi:transglutaminase-like putative cysteine protease